jgi:Domain of unknown function (DUF4390)
MMAFSTHFSKNNPINRMVRVFIVVVFLALSRMVAAQSSAELSQVRAERVEDEIVVSAQVSFELPNAVEEALLKGIPMYFVAQAGITKERWYWYDRKVAVAERYMRIAYQPLTRKWRLNVTAGVDRAGSTGLALNQSFDTLPQALAVIKRIFRWKVADASDLDGGGRHKLELRFRLDLSQLPRPFQIGAIGQSDWDVGGVVVTPLTLENNK